MSKQSGRGSGSTSIGKFCTRSKGKGSKRASALRNATVPTIEAMERRVMLSVTPTSIISFTTATNGAYPYDYGGTAVDAHGNLFGTTYEGGLNNEGDVWEVAKGSSSITDLADFNGTNGTYPAGGVRVDSSGDIFGAAEYGGANNEGTVWELASGTSTIDVLATFNGTNGAYPIATPTLDSSGDLFGTSYEGGMNDLGDVWEVPKGSTSITDLADFNGTNGSHSYSTPMIDSSGDLFGTAFYGGANNEGDVWELANGTSILNVLASFNSTNGSYPYGGTVLDSGGDIFGTGEYGGVNNEGDVWELASASSTITKLADFSNAVNGSYPAGLTVDSSGNLWGVTEYGGNIGEDGGDLFEVSAGTTNINVIYSFYSAADDLAYYPMSNPAIDSSGDVFGTTYEGGGGSVGVVYEFAGIAGPQPMDYTVPSDGDYHKLVLSLNNTGTDLQITDNGVIVRSEPLADVTDVDIIGAADQSDTLTVDYTNGFFFVPVSFDGGQGTGSHALTVQGASNSTDIYTPGASLGAGELDVTEVPFTDTIQFVNLSPVYDFNSGTLTVNGTNGNDTITYSQGTLNPLDDGLVTVNNLESIEFSNKSTLNINTELGIDTFIDDQPTSIPTGLVNPISVAGGDDNNVDTLIYQAVPDSDNVLDADGQGSGEIGPFLGDDAEAVDYSGIGTIDFNGQLSASDALDIEGEPLAFNDFTVTPASVVGAGTVTGTLDAAPTFGPVVKAALQFEDATYTIPTVNYTGLSPDGEALTSVKPAISEDYTALDFGGLDPEQAIFVVYKGLRGGEIDVYDDTFTDGYGGNDIYQSIGVFGDPEFAFTQFNLKADSSIYISVGNLSENADMFVYVDGDGLGSSDYMEFDGDGNNPIDLDPSGSISEETVGDDVSFSGITSFAVYADTAAVNLNGNNGSGNATITPVDPPAAGAADISVGTLYTQFYVTEVTVLTVNGESSAGTDSVTVDATNTNDSIVAAGGTTQTVSVNSLLPVTLGTEIGMVYINGGAGDNNLTVDSTNGAFTYPITYNGGPGNNNSLTLQGGTATSDTYSPGPLPGAGSASLVIGGDTEYVEFDNLAPVTDSVPGPLTVNGTGGNDQITYTEGPSAGQGEVSVNSFEPIIFTNKTTLSLAGGAGSDTITLDDASIPTGLTAIDVDGGPGLDTLVANAFFTAVTNSNVAPGALMLSGQPTVDYVNTEYVNIINALDTISVTPQTINGQEGKSTGNVTVGTFTGGAVGALATDFKASINWGDGSTSTGTVSGSAGSFTVTGSHTYKEEGTYHPVVTVTDPKIVYSSLVNNVYVTVFYTAPLSSTINDTANISDPSVIGTAITTPVDTIAVNTGTGTIKLATFTDPGGAEQLSDYSASINWGDGHTSTGTITVSNGVFTITGSHTYTATGTYSPKITIDHETSTPTVVTDTNRVVVVMPDTIMASGTTFTGNEGRVATGTVATFTVMNTALGTSAFSATINWGDGTTSTGTIVKDSAGHFHVTGSHAYPEEVTYPITVTIKEVGGYTGTANSTANISPSPLDELASVTTLREPLGEATFTNAVLGTFRDQSYLERDPTTYTGTINWGDGKTTTPTFVYTGSTYNVGSYWKIEGSHKYTAKGTYTVTITFHDLGGPFVNSVIKTTIVIS